MQRGPGRPRIHNDKKQYHIKLTPKHKRLIEEYERETPGMSDEWRIINLITHRKDEDTFVRKDRMAEVYLLDGVFSSLMGKGNEIEARCVQGIKSLLAIGMEYPEWQQLLDMIISFKNKRLEELE